VLYLLLYTEHQTILQVQNTLMILLRAGLTYSIGGLMYAMHWPNVAPSLFGYHEAFHICVIMASAFMYTAVKHAILQ
jgi:hemolysin III